MNHPVIGQLEACPFCQAPAFITEDVIGCGGNDCGMKPIWVRMDDETPADMRDRWNKRRSQLPAHIAAAVVKMGEVEWGAVGPLQDGEHVAHFADSLRITRENFALGDESRRLHGLYLAGTDTVLCHTGISPNSANNAQALAGAWNLMLEQARPASVDRSGEAGETRSGAKGLDPKDESAVGSEADETPTPSPFSGDPQ